MLNYIKFKFKTNFLSKRLYLFIIINLLLIIVLAQFYNFNTTLPGIMIISILSLGLLVFGMTFLEEKNSFFIKRIFSLNISKFEYIFSNLFVNSVLITFVEISSVILSFVCYRVNIIPNEIQYNYINNLINSLTYSLSPIFARLLDNFLINYIGMTYEQIFSFIISHPICLVLAEIENKISDSIIWLSSNSFYYNLSGGNLLIDGTSLSLNGFHNQTNPIIISYNSTELLSLYFEFDYINNTITSITVNGSSELGTFLEMYFPSLPSSIDNEFIQFISYSDNSFELLIDKTYFIHILLNLIILEPDSFEEVLSIFFYYIISPMYPFNADMSYYFQIITISRLTINVFIYSLFTLCFAYFLIIIFKNKEFYNFVSLLYILFIMFFGNGLLPAGLVENNFIHYLSLLCPHTYMQNGLEVLFYSFKFNVFWMTYTLPFYSAIIFSLLSLASIWVIYFSLNLK